MEPAATRSRGPGVIRVDADLELRPVRLENTDALFAAVERNRERLRRWLPWVGQTYSSADVYRFIAEQERENHTRGALTTGIWTHGVLCGAIGLHRIDPRHRSS